MKKYFGYIRVSTTKQGEQGSSLQEQRSAIEAYAQRHGLKIVEWFEEQETAAAQGRPVFGRMLKAIESRKADGVITHKIDRSARNLKDWAHIGDLVERGVEMHFAHESLDLTSRSGRLSADILAVVASDYVRNLRDEIRKGFYGRLKQGLYPLPAPLGYLDQGKGKAKTIDHERGPLIQQAFELYASGRWTFETLGHELHLRGLRNRGGGRVTHTGLSSVLNNPFYIGIIKLRGTGEVFQGVHEPLIDPGTFSAVAAVLAGRIPRRGYHKRFRYQKMLRCADCSYALTAERQRGHVYYRCHTRHCSRPSVRETEIEKQLVRLAEPILLTDTEWETVRRDVATILANIPDQTPLRRRDLGVRLAATEERMKRLTDAFIDNVIERETFMTRKEQLLHEQADLKTAIGRLSHAEGSPRLYAERMFEHIKSLSSLVETVSDEKLREILVDATSNITIRSKELEITWQNPFNQLLSKPAVISGAPSLTRLRTKALAEDIAKIAIEMAEKHRQELFANDNHSSERGTPQRSGADTTRIPDDLAV